MTVLRIVFDLDDTLYPERAYALGGFHAAGEWARANLGVEGIADRLTTLLDEGHLGQAFRIALRELVPDHSEDHLKALLLAYGRHVPDLSLFTDARAALDSLTHTPIGLITDGHDKTQARKVAALGIAPRFHKIIYTGALGPDRAFHKPHPRAFELMEHALRQSRHDRFVYVGDNPAKDFIAPNAMGWTTILIDRPEHRATRIHPLTAPPPDGAPHITLTSLDALRRTL